MGVLGGHVKHDMPHVGFSAVQLIRFQLRNDGGRLIIDLHDSHVTPLSCVPKRAKNAKFSNEAFLPLLPGDFLLLQIASRLSCEQ